MFFQNKLFFLHFLQHVAEFSNSMFFKKKSFLGAAISMCCKWRKATYRTWHTRAYKYHTLIQRHTSHLQEATPLLLSHRTQLVLQVLSYGNKKWLKVEKVSKSSLNSPVQFQSRNVAKLINSKLFMCVLPIITNNGRYYWIQSIVSDKDSISDYFR